MEAQTFENVFDALADTPAEAANMKVRAELLAALRARIGARGMPQEAAAKRLGITRPPLNDLPRGKLGKFSLDALVNLSSAAARAPACSSSSSRARQRESSPFELSTDVEWSAEAGTIRAVKS